MSAILGLPALHVNLFGRLNYLILAYYLPNILKQI